jgi:DNA-binding NtrC family response regulator
LPVNSNKLVAIVDDDLDITELFSAALIPITGIVVFKFTDPIIALEHITINKENYILIISDFKMPGLNGIELIKKVKTLNPRTRTLLMTAFEMTDGLFSEYVNDEIINGFLQKPIKLEILITEVRNQIHYHETKTYGGNWFH